MEALQVPEVRLELRHRREKPQELEILHRVCAAVHPEAHGRVIVEKEGEPGIITF